MKIVCQKNVLSKAVGLAHNAVSTKSTLPILSNLLFETSKKGVEVLGTDLEIGLRCFAEVEVVQPGAITIPARKISDILRECPDQEVEISVDEGNRITIKCGKTMFKVMGLSRDDFPNLPEVKNEKMLEIEDKELMDMIKKVHFAVSSDETRRILNGALLSVEGSTIRMVSTDGHRLSLVNRKLKKSGDKSASIIP
jgi:DNA polymerase-3 subunit beta